MPPGVDQILGYGVLGVMFVLVMLGFLAPKWVLDEYRKREAVKDSIIERQATALERLADKFEAMK